jgi:hypothetical protein
MKFRKSVLIMLLIPLILVGCTSKNIRRDKMIGQINVFGVELFSDVDYKQINGVVATEEPCLSGYERSFDALDLIIGYGFDKKIRKLNTRNPKTSLFGISPGISFVEGKQKILQAGFVESAPPFIFSADGYSITFLVNADNKIFGLTLELLD